MTARQPLWLVETAAPPPAEHSLPALVRQAANRLAAAETSAEVLEARDAAALIYDAAKRAARIEKAKRAHDEVISAVYHAQADALEIESLAKRRLADEYDLAQERGEVAGHGGDRKINLPDAKLENINLSYREIHEARRIRDAEESDPGIVRRTLDTLIDAGHEPTRAAVKRAIGTKSTTAASPAHPLAAALAGVDRHLTQADPAELLADVPEPARQEIARLAPRVARYLLNLTPPADFATDPAAGAEVQGRHGAFIADWASPPGEGTIIFLGEQRYDLIGVEARQRRDGGFFALMMWRSACPACGSAFHTTTGLRIRDLRRRCPEHRSLAPASSGGSQFGRQRLDVRILPAPPISTPSSFSNQEFTNGI